MTQIIFNTAGDGYWSNVINAQVSITDMQIGYIESEYQGSHPKFGELRVYFDNATWDPAQHGLIYTDSLFLDQLQKFLISHGLPGKDVDYSEQGMQGDDYVSLDVGGAFLQSWGRKFDIDWRAQAQRQEDQFKNFWNKAL
jgi:hypothetical protein